MASNPSETKEVANVVTPSGAGKLAMPSGAGKLAPRTVDSTKCKYNYWNLLSMVESTDTAPDVYLREFSQLRRCENFGDDSLEEASTAVENYMDEYGGKGSLARVLDGTPNDRDLVWSQQVMAHYGSWHRDILLKSLPVATRMYYHTFWKAERSLAAVTLAAVSLGLIRKSQTWASKRWYNPTHARKVNQTASMVAPPQIKSSSDICNVQVSMNAKKPL